MSKIKKKYSINYLNKKLKILHCVASYPPNDLELNLNVIKDFSKRYSFGIGYSDHSIGIEAAVIAVSIGAKIIEKHFTLDNDFSSFHDHKVSLNPKDMKLMVNKIRNAEIMLGKGNKKIQKNEKKIIHLARRSFYTQKKIKIGEIMNEKNLIALRPSLINSYGLADKAKIFKKRCKKNMNKGAILKK